MPRTRVELKGIIEVAGEKGSHEFACLVKELAPAGQLSGLQAFKFSQDVVLPIARVISRMQSCGVLNS